jgi:hypothetical protein
MQVPHRASHCAAMLKATGIEARGTDNTLTIRNAQYNAAIALLTGAGGWTLNDDGSLTRNDIGSNGPEVITVTVDRVDYFPVFTGSRYKAYTQ